MKYDHAMATALFILMVLTVSAMPTVAAETLRIDSVYLSGDTTAVIDTDRPFTDRSLGELADDILNRYYDRGYYWASTRVDKVRKHGRSVALELQFTRGPLVQLADLVCTGLTRTNPDLIKRHIPAGPGDTLTPSLIRRTEQAVSGIPFVTLAEPPEIRPRAGYTEADLHLSFIEKKQFTLEGGGGYLSDRAGGVLWHLNLHFNNLFGGGQQATVASERREKGRSLLRLAYGQPVYLTGVGYLSLRSETRNYRDDFYEFSLGGSYSVHPGDNFNIGLDLDWKSVEPAGRTPSYSRLSAGLFMQHDRIDDRLNPVQGLRLRWSATYSYRRYHADSDAVAPMAGSYNETRGTVTVEWFKKVAGRFVNRFELSYRALQTDEALPPLSELILVGGPGTLRGFRNEQYAALHALTGTVEPRVRFTSGYLFCFYDAAYLNNRVSDPSGEMRTQELYRNGYGCGFALRDRTRGVSVSLGWNPELPFDQPWLAVELVSDI
ncbi:MAG TPA: BamA/TamA family outer membrane protein [Candidatus Deferrimicrobium sp.]|nr:BamA/TamA family outer membrane protein [Candidatus Deferrimicrobium sp.]